MKAVMISIRPEWCEKIAQGRKTVELRKTRPKLQTPFKCYIYCTERGRPLVYGDVPSWGGYREEYTQTYGYSKEKARKIWDVYNGHVMGEFVCDAVLSHCEMANADLVEQMSCVRWEKILEYSGGKEVFGWHISDLEIYDTPKELSEFLVKCNEICEDCDWWEYVKVNDVEFDMDCTSPLCGYRPLKRPPQSWCYVEELP